MDNKDISKTFSLRINKEIQEFNKKQSEALGINESAGFKKAVEAYYLSYKFEKLLKQYEELEDIGDIPSTASENHIKQCLPEFVDVLYEFINESEIIFSLREQALKIKQKLDFVSNLDKYFLKIRLAKSKELSQARNLIYTALDMTSLLEDNKHQELEKVLELVDKENELEELNKIIESKGGKEGILRAMHSY